MAAAVLLIDLQRDFLGSPGAARLPVGEAGAAAVLAAANAILAGRRLPGALPVLIVTAFPRSARFANFFRHQAALAGSAGAGLDPRLELPAGVRVLTKTVADAFSNPELEALLRGRGVTELYVLGVFAEGCVRATVLGARRRGYAVTVLAGAVASNARWKQRLALWSMRRAGARVASG